MTNKNEKLEEIVKLCQSIIDMKTEFIPSDDHIELASIILEIIEK